MFEVFRDTSPLVEAISVDEAFIDVGGLRRISGTPVEIAARLRSDVRYRVGLPITVGIARTKFLAKVASQEAKPDGLLLVPPGRELAFLHPLPVRRLWGVGAVTADKLRAHGIDTVADVAELSESMLASLVGGAMGGRLYALSHNVDARRVTTGVRRRSVGAQRALGRAGNTMSAAEIDAVVIGLIDRIAGRMRAAGRTGRTVTLRLRFNDFGRATRSHTLPWATCSTHALLGTARRLVAAAAPLIAERGLTLVGFAVSEIDRDGAEQLTLPFTHRGPSPPPSTRRSTRCVDATAALRSPAECWSVATPDWRCRTYRTDAVHSSSLSTGQVLTMRSTGTPASSARWAP